MLEWVLVVDESGAFENEEDAVALGGVMMLASRVAAFERRVHAALGVVPDRKSLDRGRLRDLQAELARLARSEPTLRAVCAFEGVTGECAGPKRYYELLRAMVTAAARELAGEAGTHTLNVVLFRRDMKQWAFDAEHRLIGDVGQLPPLPAEAEVTALSAPVPASVQVRFGGISAYRSHPDRALACMADLVPHLSRRARTPPGAALVDLGSWLSAIGLELHPQAHSGGPRAERFVVDGQPRHLIGLDPLPCQLAEACRP